MSVRIIARIRPLLSSELEKDSIVQAVAPEQHGERPTAVSIPNPKNPAESFNFCFNCVYDRHATQQDIFENEVAPTVKHLFNGFDTTIFAYGVTGTGKTHTMRGGKSLAERGVIPRLLSGIYRRCRKVERDSIGETHVQVAMSYYEIYKDRVFDLFEPLDKRTPAGLPIRDHNGKSIVCGLTERPCETLKDFEILYDQANVNRSTGATKLNAHSSRSHAILCVKVSQTTANHTTTSTASAIDLAGSEDNRRTDNVKERMVESSSINKSLFVLAQCVEAINKKYARIPYRESKMTRVLSLGQNNGLMIMILNLAPVASYHLDTLTSLNFANRTKQIRTREVENEPIFRTLPKHLPPKAFDGASMQRQPLRSISDRANLKLGTTDAVEKPHKSFMVYSEKERTARTSDSARLSSQKRPSSGCLPLARPSKMSRLARLPPSGPTCELSRADVEDLVNRLVEEKLASRSRSARSTSPPAPSPPPAASASADVSGEVKRRLEELEQRVERHEDARAEGLQFLLMARQHAARGEDVNALRMYRLAAPFFPGNARLHAKMMALSGRITAGQSSRERMVEPGHGIDADAIGPFSNDVRSDDDVNDAAYEPNASDAPDDSFTPYSPPPPVRQRHRHRRHDTASNPLPNDNNNNNDHDSADNAIALTPRTQRLLAIINSHDLARITQLRGIGRRKAESIVAGLSLVVDGRQSENGAGRGPDDGDSDSCAVRRRCAGSGSKLVSLAQLARVKGVGARMVQNMREGLGDGNSVLEGDGDA